MSLEHDLRRALQEEAGDLRVPPELKGTILSRIAPGQGGKRMKKWLVAAVVAATLIIPTGAYAGYNYLADSIFGSQDNLVKIGGTQGQYDRFEAKLQQAKSSLTKEEFAEFSALLQELTGYNLQIADEQGALDPGKLSAADQKRYRELAAEIEAYNEKLSGAEASGAAASTTDVTDISKEFLAKAEQNFSGEELATVKQLITEWAAYHTKITARDGGSPTDIETAELAKLTEELNPYLEQMGYRMKPSN